MKTPFFKRAVALILAALMILGTLGYLFSTIAYAEEGEGEEGSSQSSTDNPASDSIQTQEETQPVTPLAEPAPVERAIDWTLWLIQTNKNVDKDVINKGQYKDENYKKYVKYDFHNEQKRNSTIEEGDLVSFRIQISEPNLTNPDDIWKGGFSSNGTKAYISVVVDNGSFSPTPHTNSKTKDGSEYTVKRVSQPDNGATGIVYEIELTKLKYSGKGNTLGITIKGGNNGYTANENYLITYQTEIPQCKETEEEPEKTPTVNEPDDPDPAPMEMATPYVIINNYDYGGIITAGETFPLTITLYNTSKNIDVENMMVTITMPEAFMLTSSSNTFYIEELHNEESVTKTVNVTAKANADPQSHNIDISMKYQYVDEKINTRKDNTTQEIISIPVVQVDRFQLTGVDVPMEVYVGEESYLSVNFVNKGRSEVYNLSAEISGDIQNPGQQQNLGNLASGATGTADFYITPNGEGVCTGEVLITYEDTNMEEKTATIQWSTNVVDPFGGMDFGGDFGEFDPGMMEDPSLMEGEQKSSLPFIAGGVGIAAVVAALVIRKRIQRKKREAEDADL